MIGVIRSLFTYIKSKLPTDSTNRETYKKYGKLDIIKTDRLDVMANTIRSDIKKKYSLERSKASNILETKSEQRFYTPKRNVLNQCVRDAMLYPLAGSLKFNQ